MESTAVPTRPTSSSVGPAARSALREAARLAPVPEALHRSSTSSQAPWPQLETLDLQASLSSGAGDSPMAAPLRHCPPLPLGVSRGVVGSERSSGSLAAAVSAGASAIVRRATSAASRGRSGSRNPPESLQLTPGGPLLLGVPTLQPPTPFTESPVPSLPPSPPPPGGSATAAAEPTEVGEAIQAVEEPPPPPAPARQCPICFEALEAAAGETFCGVHLYCADCAGRSARRQLEQGQVPRCPDCHTDIEPVAAQRILHFAELERYYHLALWSNDGVAVCPRCGQGLYTDEGADPCAGIGCRNAHCPACLHEFCVECRGPAHSGIADCDEAARRLQRRAGRRGAVVTTVEGMRAAPATPFSCRAAYASGSSSSTFGGLGTCGATCYPEVQDASFSALGVKACPRCRAGVEKSDEASCNHMTCANCRHEFCWTCLADRKVIYAHGNHYHRPSCHFFAAYDGVDAVEYLPEKCKRCARRKTACRPLTAARGDRSALVPSGQQGTLDQWLWAVMELFTLRSCQAPPR